MSRKFRGLGDVCAPFPWVHKALTPPMDVLVLCVFKSRKTTTLYSTDSFSEYILQNRLKPTHSFYKITTFYAKIISQFWRLIFPKTRYEKYIMIWIEFSKMDAICKYSENQNTFLIEWKEFPTVFKDSTEHIMLGHSYLGFKGEWRGDPLPIMKFQRNVKF